MTNEEKILLLITKAREWESGRAACFSITLDRDELRVRLNLSGVEVIGRPLTLGREGQLDADSLQEALDGVAKGFATHIEAVIATERKRVEDYRGVVEWGERAIKDLQDAMSEPG